jgi:cell wall-associated NlpC family hydrolase
VSSRPSETRAPGVRLRLVVRNALLGASTLALAAAVFTGPATTPAAAAPPLTVAEAKAQVDQLQTDAAAIDEDATEVKVKLAAGAKQLAMKQEDVRRQTALVSRIRKQVGQVALAQFQNRNFDTTAQLFLTSDTDGFLNQMSTVEKVSENQNTILQDYQSSQARLADLERAADVDVAALKVQDQQLARLRAASATKVTQAKAVLARLTEEERQRILAEEAAVQAAAKKAAEDAAAAEAAKAAADRADQEAATQDSSDSSDSGDFSSTTDTDDSSTGPGSSDSSSSSSSKGQIALAYAKKQLGKPYVWGATGPRSFDCSGLTSSAWRAAGVSIPRVSRAQSTGAGRAISKSELRPGDLVFFYSPVSHVAMYVGNGVVIHAPRPGKSVTYTEMSHMPYAGARRPG